MLPQNTAIQWNRGKAEEKGRRKEDSKPQLHKSQSNTSQRSSFGETTMGFENMVKRDGEGAWRDIYLLLLRVCMHPPTSAAGQRTT